MSFKQFSASHNPPPKAANETPPKPAAPVVKSGDMQPEVGPPTKP